MKVPCDCQLYRRSTKPVYATAKCLPVSGIVWQVLTIEMLRDFPSHPDNEMTFKIIISQRHITILLVAREYLQILMISASATLKRIKVRTMGMLLRRHCRGLQFLQCNRLLLVLQMARTEHRAEFGNCNPLYDRNRHFYIVYPLFTLLNYDVDG